MICCVADDNARGAAAAQHHDNKKTDMAKKKKKITFEDLLKMYPIGNNFERYGLYKLPCVETIFFEWLLFKQVYRFRLQPFYYSVPDMEEELRINRAKLIAMRKKFNKLGFLYTKRGHLPNGQGNVNWYELLFEELLEVMPDIMNEKNERFGSMREYLEACADLKSEEDDKKFNEALTGEDFVPEKVRTLFERLNANYELAIDRYNESGKSKERGRKKEKMKIPMRKHIQAAKNMLADYDIHTISNAFLAFCEQRLEEKGGVNVATFFTYDKKLKCFVTLEHFIEYFQEHYSYGR